MHSRTCEARSGTAEPLTSRGGFYKLSIHFPLRAESLDSSVLFAARSMTNMIQAIREIGAGGRDAGIGPAWPAPPTRWATPS